MGEVPGERPALCIRGGHFCEACNLCSGCAGGCAGDLNWSFCREDEPHLQTQSGAPQCCIK